MEQNQMATPPQTDAGAMAVADSYSTMLTDPKVLNTLDKIAKFHAASQIVPKQFQGNVPNCFVACEMANRMGISPMIVMQNLYVVQGKPAWSGQACIALINGTRLFSPLKFVFVGTPGEPNYGCYVTCTRLSDGETLTGTLIDMRMAQAEGWLSKEGSKWLTMPEQMLQYRAAAFFARVHCPHALMGLQTVEEVKDASGYEAPEKQTIVISMEGASE